MSIKKKKKEKKEAHAQSGGGRKGHYTFLERRKRKTVWKQRRYRGEKDLPGQKVKRYSYGTKGEKHSSSSNTEEANSLGIYVPCKRYTPRKNCMRRGGEAVSTTPREKSPALRTS